MKLPKSRLQKAVEAYGKARKTFPAGSANIRAAADEIIRAAELEAAFK